MGLLLNREYWANVTNQIFRLRPSPGKVMKIEDANAIHEIACRAFTDLYQDKEFDKDIEYAKSLAKEADSLRDSVYSGFANFVDEMNRAERNILFQSGVYEEICVKVFTEIDRLAIDIKSKYDHLDQLDGQIGVCRQIICKAYEAEDLNSKHDPLWKEFLHGTMGLALIGIDAGTPIAVEAVFPNTFHAATTDLAKTFLGTSITHGGKVIWKVKMRIAKYY